MFTDKNKNLKFYIFFFIILVILFYLFINKFQKKTDVIINPISVNLLTSVHPKLSWDFKPVNSKVFVKPGEVTTIEYIVENLSDTNATGIATFAYFPNQFENYISKINCFCYDAQTLKAKQKDKFVLVLLIDPEVTKDSKTKDIKEVTIQFTFFDYKSYNEKKS
tara:strand:+ start:270 stop:761 length:492 start_codon:yes stop_codon:yes gene_type:complete